MDTSIYSNSGADQKGYSLFQPFSTAETAINRGAFMFLFSMIKVKYFNVNIRKHSFELPSYYITTRFAIF